MKIKLLFVLSFLCIQLHAQDDIVIGKTYNIESKILKEGRTINISLPSDYEGGNSRYPVLYLLDGGYHFNHTSSLVEYLAGNERIPHMIVVGILNTDRTRDLTPVAMELDEETSKNMITRGGADNFLAFMEKELIPHIESNYRTAPYRVLVGHSLGGLLAAYSLFNNPGLFDAEIAISPSLWYKNEKISATASKFLDSHKDLENTFYMTMASEGGEMLGGAYQLASEFENHKERNEAENFRFDFQLMPDQDHGSVPHLSTYNGLEFIFEGFKPEIPQSKEEVLNTGGPRAMIDRLVEHYKNISEKYGYEISSEPVINQWGYVFVNEAEDNFKEAGMYAFKLNVKNHPESANVYDSLGDGYLIMKRKDEARKSFEKAVEIAKKTGHPVLETSQQKLNDLKAG